jgi:hypothetical protein
MYAGRSAETQIYVTKSDIILRSKATSKLDIQHLLQLTILYDGCITIQFLSIMSSQIVHAAYCAVIVP